MGLVLGTLVLPISTTYISINMHLIVTPVSIAHVGRVSRLKIGLIDKVIFASQLPGVVYKLCQVEAPSNTHLLRGGHVSNIGVANPNRGYIE